MNNTNSNTMTQRNDGTLAASESINAAPMINDKHLRFLDGLRESGACNMFGASTYLVEMYGMSKRDASATLSHWMATFSERHPKG